MRTIRALASTRSTTQRALFAFAVAFTLIAGLLAMHVIMAGAGHSEEGAAITGHHAGVLDAAIPETDGTSAAPPAAASAVAFMPLLEAGHCPGDCGDDHSMLTMVCVLALLVAAIVLLLPALLARLDVAAALAARILRRLKTSLLSRPPSLLVLSISRT